MRVLVVEDETKMAALLKRGLEEEGYAVDVAATGTEALWAGTETEYDAIVLDVMLPELDGFEVCRQLRARDRWAPVLMLTARDDVRTACTASTPGADDYLVKPFSFAELLARLRALLRRGGGERPAVLSVRRPRPRPGHTRVPRGDVEVGADAQGVRAARVLPRHRGEVLSRTRILEHVWDFAYDGDSNVVDVYVRYLREKVDRPFGRDSIETVRGSGYRLREDP